MYEIKQNFIPGLPQTPYENGVGAYEGVEAHSTANKGDSIWSERSWEVQDWQNGFVHFFTDDTGTLQVADINYKGWGAGPTANKKYVHCELCETNDPVKFQKAYTYWTWLMAWVLFQKSLPVTDGITLRSHKQTSNQWRETDHQDPIAYLAEHGKTWSDVVNDVTTEYNKMKGVVKVEEWKLEGIKYLHDNGLLQDYDGWVKKLEDPIPAWAAFLILERIHKSVKGGK